MSAVVAAPPDPAFGRGEPAPGARLSRRDGGRAQRIATRVFGYGVLAFFALVFIYPFVIQLTSAFKTEPNAAANPLSPVPDPITTESVERIFTGTGFPVW